MIKKPHKITKWYYYKNPRLDKKPAEIQKVFRCDLKALAELVKQRQSIPVWGNLGYL